MDDQMFSFLGFFLSNLCCWFTFFNCLYCMCLHIVSLPYFSERSSTSDVRLTFVSHFIRLRASSSSASCWWRWRHHQILLTRRDATLTANIQNLRARPLARPSLHSRQHHRPPARLPLGCRRRRHRYFTTPRRDGRCPQIPPDAPETTEWQDGRHSPRTGRDLRSGQRTAFCVSLCVLSEFISNDMLQIISESVVSFLVARLLRHKELPNTVSCV